MKELKVKPGDKVSEGTLILLLDSGAAAQTASAPAPKTSVAAPPAPTSAATGVAEVRVPDIGDFKDVPVIEIMVKPGDTVKAEDALITLESDKATMDVPAPLAGAVKDIKVKVGDKVSGGRVVLTLATGNAAAGDPRGRSAWTQRRPRRQHRRQMADLGATAAQRTHRRSSRSPSPYAGPGVRKLAREARRLRPGEGHRRQGPHPEGKTSRVSPSARPSGENGADRRLPSAGVGGIDLLPWPKVDFAKFGPVESKPLSRIKKISGANLHRNWVMIPHVTNHDDADITDLEAFRVQLNKENEKSGVRVSMLAFMIKVAVATLKKFPEFNASLDGDNLILKKYYHIGFAADTPQGLMVPVIRDADRKGVVDIAKEMGDLAKLARDGKLKPDQMQGGCFTISSLGGIGGIYFTPIINAPEVAIMGVCRSFWKQVSPDGKQSSWRFVLPLSLSWDHRVIDGASAARFNNHFASLLADMRRVLI